MVLGMIMTALPAINAIPHVCRARSPGIVTYLDLPLVTPRGWVPSERVHGRVRYAALRCDAAA